MSRRRVLICDDAAFTRNLLRDILGEAGFEVAGEAGNGREAVERYRELKPDVVTLDIVMPEMGGLEAARVILQEDPSARIVMCSAMGQRAMVVQAIEAGARDFVVKPFQPGRLLEAVERALA